MLKIKKIVEKLQREWSCSKLLSFQPHLRHVSEIYFTKANIVNKPMLMLIYVVKIKILILIFNGGKWLIGLKIKPYRRGWYRLFLIICNFIIRLDLSDLYNVLNTSYAREKFPRICFDDITDSKNLIFLPPPNPISQVSRIWSQKSIFIK